VLNTAEKYCKSCTNNCCNGNKHYIDYIKESELELFIERGLPIFKLSELSHMGKNKKGNFFFSREELFTSNGKPVPKPAIIQQSEGVAEYEAEYMLHLKDFCPLYDEKKGCTVHEDPRRPETCRKYPVFPSMGIEDSFELRENCEIFNTPEIIQDFEETFKGPFIQLITRTIET
jgi:hypothetical protein